MPPILSAHARASPFSNLFTRALSRALRLVEWVSEDNLEKLKTLKLKGCALLQLILKELIAQNTPFLVQRFIKLWKHFQFSAKWMCVFCGRGGKRTLSLPRSRWPRGKALSARVTMRRDSNPLAHVTLHYFPKESNADLVKKYKKWREKNCSV